jgi:hypothetical protein
MNIKYWFALTLLVGGIVWYITYKDSKKKWAGRPNDTFGPIGSVLK